MLSPCTTFANGINPFAAGNAAHALLNHPTEDAPMPIPAKPARKNAKRLKDEDYSTAYKPPMIKPEDCDNEGCGELIEPAPKVATSAPELATKIRYVDATNLVICDDPLPLGRSIVEGKYDEKFKAMKIGQAVKCLPAAVGLTQNAMRKFIKVRGLKGVVVRTCKDYGDGLGRVWMLAEPVKALKVAV